MTLKSMTNEEIDKIADDLIRRCPRGPDNLYRKSDYKTKYQYNSSANVWRYTPVPVAEGYGYGHETLTSMFCSLSERLYERDLWRYVNSRWTELSEKARTRRGNLFVDRVVDSYSRFRNGEGRGIYTVSLRAPLSLHGISMFYVRAASCVGAANLGRVMLAGFGMSCEVKNLRINRKYPDRDDLYERVNKEVLDGIDTYIAGRKERAKKYQTAIDCATEERESFVEMFINAKESE